MAFRGTLADIRAANAIIDARVLRALLRRDLDSVEIRNEVPRFSRDAVGRATDRLDAVGHIREVGRCGMLIVWRITDAGRAALQGKAA